MTIRYANLGLTKRVTEIVFAGSHDASITSGKSNAQTQDLNIKGQAEAGVRLFDLRILAHGSKEGASLVGFHGKGGGKGTSTLDSQVTGKTHSIKTNSSMSYGTTGLKLSDMLRQAQAFVESTGEFLIFKFDKSTNYSLIADYCVKLLGDNIYKPLDIEFGKLQLDDLARKVVCVFNDDALSEIKGFGAKDGILGFRSLRGDKNKIKQYDNKYPGLQYYGKGGTAAWKVWHTRKGKLDENEQKQKKMLLAMGSVQEDWAADALGMMYWTSTAVSDSIRTRNEDVMWGATGVRRMKELWHAGLDKAITNQLQRDKVKVLEFGGVRRVKAYFPNIIMIDFADPSKCQTIYDLNTAADQKLAQAYDKYTAA